MSASNQRNVETYEIDKHSAAIDKHSVEIDKHNAEIVQQCYKIDKRVWADEWALDVEPGDIEPGVDVGTPDYKSEEKHKLHQL